ncbi:MAG: hypothetical protein HKL95_03595 [Phycisphaerae bacterium]|nr:hypothetical protein [Phycisphaerae bacterium]
MKRQTEALAAPLILSTGHEPAGIADYAVAAAVKTLAGDWPNILWVVPLLHF